MPVAFGVFLLRGEPAHPRADERFEVAVGGRTVRVQVAVTEEEQRRGLQERPRLDPDEGMLFVYPTPRAVTYSMKDTPLALDIAYFEPDGALTEVRAGVPLDRAGLPSRSRRVQFVLELNQGWFRASGLVEGARLDLRHVAAALKAREVDPREFGLNP